MKRKRGAVTKAVRRSRTISGALVTFGATIGGVFSEAVSVAVKAAAEFATLAPVVSLGTALGLETNSVMLSLALAGIAMSVFARLDDAAKGHNTR